MTCDCTHHGPRYEPVATCECGRGYGDTSWRQLPYCGDRTDGCPPGVKLEMRSCVCGLHIGRPMMSGVYLSAAEFERRLCNADG